MGSVTVVDEDLIGFDVRRESDLHPQALGKKKKNKKYRDVDLNRSNVGTVGITHARGGGAGRRVVGSIASE